MPLYARSSIAHNRVNEDEQNKAKRIEIAKSLAEKIIALEYSGPKTAARALEAVEARVSYQQIARQLTKLREESGKRPRTVEAREELKEAESIALEAATAEEEAGEEGAAGGGKRARTVEVPVYSSAGYPCGNATHISRVPSTPTSRAAVVVQIIVDVTHRQRIPVHGQPRPFGSSPVLCLPVGPR